MHPGTFWHQNRHQFHSLRSMSWQLQTLPGGCRQFLIRSGFMLLSMKLPQLVWTFSMTFRRTFVMRQVDETTWQPLRPQGPAQVLHMLQVSRHATEAIFSAWPCFDGLSGWGKKWKTKTDLTDLYCFYVIFWENLQLPSRGRSSGPAAKLVATRPNSHQ